MPARSGKACAPISPEGPASDPPFAARRHEIHRVFADLCDYLWKLPDFLETERRIERDKMADRYPESGDRETAAWHDHLRTLRFADEFTKLWGSFPRFMASSALLTVISQFEHQLLCIHRELEEIGLAGERRRGGGIGASLAQVERIAGDRWPPPLLRPIQCGILFRNCLAHADGNVSLSRDAAELRRILRTREYCPREQLDRRPVADPRFDPGLASSRAGALLAVPMAYSHWLSWAARECLLGICDAVDPVLLLPLEGCRP